MPTLLAPPILDDIGRRGLLTGLGAVTALAACGAPVPATPAGPATRTVDSRFGPVEVPLDPQRVVTASDTTTAYALVLGLPLVGAPGEYADGANPLPRFQTDAYPAELAAVTRVTTYPVAAEEIAALDPDLILGGDAEEHPILSAIAPTYSYTDFVPVDGVTDVPDWRRGLRELAAAVDRSPRAEEYITGYDERTATLRDRLAAPWGAARVAVVNPLPDHIGVFGRQYYTPNDVLAVDLGLTMSTAVQGEYRQLSLEQLGLVDADVLFVAVGSVPGTVDRDPAQLAPYAASPLWPRIPAVAAGRVHEFDRSIVYASPLTATAFLDIVETALLPGGAS